MLWGLSPERGSNKGRANTAANKTSSAAQPKKIEDARFIPPPPKEAQAAMDDLERYLNREVAKDAERLIDIALIHYQVETIHPFNDGNGRLGRMLVTLTAMKAGFFDAPLLYVSPAIEGDKDRYIDLMFNVSARGDWHEWLEFFFEKIASACRNTVSLIDRLLQYQEHLRTEVRGQIRSANAMHLVDLLFEVPAINITVASERIGITYNAAKNLIERLVELSILDEAVGFYPKTFIARGILNTAQNA